MKHLTEQQLLAFRDGEKDDPRIREHLATCEKCQRRFDDSRWRLSLRRLASERDEGHPSSEELTAFWDNALSPGAGRRIQRHLRSCNRCLAVYRRMRVAEPGRAYASPAPDLVKRAQKRFSSRPSGIDLGEYWVQLIGGMLQLTREPGEEHLLGLVACRLAGDVADDLSLSDAPHPSSARARMQRLGGKPVRLEAGNLRIVLRVVDEAGLGMHLSWGDTGEPATGVRLLIDADEEGKKEGSTDRHGAAWLPFSWGSMRLQIQTRTPVRLKINNTV